MKNDLDFIRDKIDNSGVYAPENMNEDYVLGQLDGVQPKPTVLPQKNQRRWKAAVASAAALVLVAGIGTAIGVSMHSANVKAHTLELPGGLSLHRFSDKSEIKSALNKIHDDNNRVRLSDYLDAAGEILYGTFDKEAGMGDELEFSSGADMLSDSDSYNNGYAGESEDVESLTGSASAGSSGSDSFSETYTQVEGVDEADIIKTDDRYIYCVDHYSNEIVIFSAAGENSEKVAEIDIEQAFESNDRATNDESDDFDYENYYLYSRYQHINDIYVKDDRLIVMCSDGGNSSDFTDALVYDVSDMDNIALLDRMAQSGGYTSSRMIGDMLYTVSSYYVNRRDYIPRCGSCDGDAIPGEIAVDDVYALEEPDNEAFLVVSAYNTADFTAQTESKAILGAAEDIYCNTENLYIYSTRYEYRGGVDWLDGGFWSYTSDATSQLLKVSLTDGIGFVAYTELDGYIDDQYALDEYQGNLRVATTSTNDNGDDVNNLYVLDGGLNQLGSVTGFAQDESIKAVRYLGDTAYVITYEQTDPLFVIDLSDPADPVILGEVKISGFSTMLVPVDENTLLGIGYYTAEEDYTYLEVQEGVKLALFDVSDKANPQVLDSIAYVDCSSPVQYNPRALVYNPERNDYVIPLNYYHYDWYDYENRSREAYGGMLNFKIKDGKIVEIDRYAADYEDGVDRCVYVGDTVYMIHQVNYGELALDATAYR